MRVDILTLFPEMFPPVLDHSIVGRARKKGFLQVCCHQLRQFSPDSRGRVDDTVFGGGVDRMSANGFSHEVGLYYADAKLDETPKVAEKRTIAGRIDPETLKKLVALRDKK